MRSLTKLLAEKWTGRKINLRVREGDAPAEPETSISSASADYFNVGLRRTPTYERFRLRRSVVLPKYQVFPVVSKSVNNEWNLGIFGILTETPEFLGVFKDSKDSTAVEEFTFENPRGGSAPGIRRLETECGHRGT
jgi:hypothetical protein